MTFENLGLSADLLATVAREGYTEPTPVQSAAIPLIMAGRDILAAAQTGTGKTAAFVLPILENLRHHGNAGFSPARHPVRVLILTPTRELAVQIAESVKTYGRGVPLRSAVVYGGTRIDPEIKMLWNGVEILVATPGRLLDHIGQRSVNLTAVEILVLDEADRMLDMGFIPDVRKIVASIPAKRQTLLFSATFSDEIRQMAGEFLTNPETVEVAARNSIADNLTQVLYPVDTERKADLLLHLIKRDQMEQVLVFTRSKLGASRLASYLDRRGVSTSAIHGDRSQPERTRALAAFKGRFVKVLVATDVASRGLDIEDLPYVVNFELPNDPQDYIHRIGRTGRAGASGTAISLVSPDEVEELRGVQRLLRKAIPYAVVEEFLPDRDREPAPTRRFDGRSGARTFSGRGRSGQARPAFVASGR
ncbi:MAG TPA: DEAD/DEAH box helicase [Candidatus Limnocylindrales bacterium]|nr:DEAD/DEAH box helicase [Candidatus Limnocylindrales bacterium]